MGDSKRRQLTIAARLQSAPGCIYCAYARPATTIDHMPPRSVFTEKRRPKGLEFPSCEPCNAGTKTTDQFAALMSRVFPDASNQAALADIRKYASGIANNEPELLLEMTGSSKWRRDAQLKLPPGTHPLNCAGPRVSLHMETFAAKFGFAMHYEATGRAIGAGGAVAARWYSNSDALEGNFPAEALELFGPPKTLRQGRFHVSDQFEYLKTNDEKTNIWIFSGMFRQSFAVLALTSETDRNMLEKFASPTQLWLPGTLAI